MNESPDLTTLLDGLIEKVKDGEEGFRTAAKDVDSKNLREMFTTLSEQRAMFLNQLQALAKSLGEKQPETEGSVVGAAHCGWIDLRAAVATQNSKAILEECERGENTAVAAFGEALDKDLPDTIRGTVADQFAKIQAVRDRIKRLVDRMKDATDQQVRW